MTARSITRRSALKFAGLITMAAIRWPGGSARAMKQTARGYGTDPNLLKREVTWIKTLGSAELSTLASLCDIILPAEPPHPSAAALQVPVFLDEWLSAPYPQMQADRAVILGGLHKLDDSMLERVRVQFRNAPAPDQLAIFDQACSAVGDQSVAFPRRLIELVCAGYYTTREGHAAIGYVGNMAAESFHTPRPEIMRYLAQALTADRWS